MLRALAFGGLIALLGTRASADIYIIPPAPVQIALAASQRVVSVNAQAYRAVRAERAFIQLALVASPQFAPTPPPQHAATLVKPQVEDPTPTPLIASQTVAQADLDKARAALVAWGVPSSAITTATLQSTNSRDGIGQVLVSITPPTVAQFDRLSQRVSEARLRFPQLRPAGIVLWRKNCDVQRSVAVAALQQADVRAALLANAAGFAPGKRIRNDGWYANASPYRYQLLCAAQTPRMPPYEVWPGELPDRPYQVMDNRGVLYALASQGPVPANVRFDEMETPVTLDGVLFAHQFRVPWNEPFVGALGRFTAFVRPDMVVAIFSVPQSPPDEVARRMWAGVDGAIGRSGTRAPDVVHTDTAVYARLTYSKFIWLQNATATMRARYKGANLYFGAVPIVFDCAGARAAVAARAFAQARGRALAIASVAHVHLGGVFAIDDGGETMPALCGYARNSVMTDIVRAIPDQVGNADDSRAMFSSAVAVAWHLEVPAAHRANAEFRMPWYAFSTPGAGFLGSGTTLQSAARNALGQLHGSGLQALIDEGAIHGPQYPGPLSERVLAVGGI